MRLIELASSIFRKHALPIPLTKWAFPRPSRNPIPRLTLASNEYIDIPRHDKPRVYLFIMHERDLENTKPSEVEGQFNPIGIH